MPLCLKSVTNHRRDVSSLMVVVHVLSSSSKAASQSFAVLNPANGPSEEMWRKGVSGCFFDGAAPFGVVWRSDFVVGFGSLMVVGNEPPRGRITFGYLRRLM